MTRQTYFLHIPKTAGTSFRRVLERHFAPADFCPVTALPGLAEVVRRDPGELARYPLIAGHLGYHVVPYLPAYPHIITMLREPLARTISTFSYITREKAHWIHRMTDLFRDPAVTIEAFLDFAPALNLVSNFQTRHIALSCDIASGFLDEAGNTVFPGMGRLLAEFTATDRLDPQLLDTAKSRLARFAFVGITERFSDSMQLLARYFGWAPDREPPTSNAAPEDTLTVEALDVNTRARIEACIALDIELYRFARERFEQRLRECNAGD